MQHISPSWHCGRNTRRGPSHRLKTNLLCLAALFLFALMPSAGWAQTRVNVSSSQQFRAALEDATVSQINITGNFNLDKGHIARKGNETKPYSSAYIVRGSKTITGNDYTISRGSYRNSTIFLAEGANLTINNLKFDGQNKLNYAPLFYVNAYEDVNPSTNDTNVIHVNAKLTMNNCTIENCLEQHADPSYFGPNPISGITGSDIYVNPKNPSSSNYLSNEWQYTTWYFVQATGGAAIHFAPDAVGSDDEDNTITLNNCTFNNNECRELAGKDSFTSGGAIVLASDKSNGGTFENCTFTGNKAGDRNGKGGAVYLDRLLREQKTFLFKGTTEISQNTAHQGGGICQWGGNLVITTTNNNNSQTIKIDNNKATATASAAFSNDTGGGGILAIGGTTTFTGTASNRIQIINNKATNGYGGGILVQNAKTSFTYCNIGSSGNGNYAAVRGGGIYLVIEQNALNASFTNCNIDYNYTINADSEGGGVYNYGTLSVNSANTFIDCNINNNGEYNSENESYKTMNGGGVYLYGTTKLNNCTISNNTANQGGGGIYYKKGCLEDLNYIYSNTATYGGGVFVDPVDNEVTLSNLSIGYRYDDEHEFIPQENTAQDGGGVYTYGENGKTIKLFSCDIRYNVATRNGGGLCMANENSSRSHTVELTGGTLIDSNHAGNGGGVHLTNVPALTLKLTNTTLSNNVATGNGGGICNYNNTVTSEGATEVNITGNQAQLGGGVYIGKYGTSNGGTANLGGNTTFVNNTANGSGGGLFVAVGATTNFLVGGVIDFNDNTATLNGGGFSNMGTVTQQVTQEAGTCTLTFDHNIANNDGGGVYQRGNPLTLTNAIFKNNEANNNGGGIYTITNCTLKNCTIGEDENNGNKAINGNGGGIYKENDTLTIQGGSVSHNTASNNGGGIYLEKRQTFVNNNCCIQNNVATNNGGGIYVYGSNTEIATGINYEFAGLTVVNADNDTIGRLNYNTGEIVSTSNEDVIIATWVHIFVDQGNELFPNGFDFYHNITLNDEYVSGQFSVQGTPYEIDGFIIDAGVQNVASPLAEEGLKFIARFISTGTTTPGSFVFVCPIIGYEGELGSYYSYDKVIAQGGMPTTLTLNGSTVGGAGTGNTTDGNEAINGSGGGIYIEKKAVVIMTSDGAGGTYQEGITNEVTHNKAKKKAGGVYKDGTLQVEGKVIITGNEAGGGSKAGEVPENVYIPTESDDDQTILIIGELACGSSIGVTKTKKWMGVDDNDYEGNATSTEASPQYGSQGEHIYDRDDHLKQVRTAIAKVSPSSPTQTWAKDAFHKRIFFDDKGYYRVWSFNYSNSTNTDKAYSDQNDYFIETWRSYADADGFNNNTVSTNAGFAYFAKQVNDGTTYSNVTLNQNTTIDLAGHYWEPIGYTFCGECGVLPHRPFAGTNNGNGHFILNAISILPEKEMGLFGNVTGTVKHTFAVGNLFANTHDHGEGSLGAIVGNTTGTIDGCEAAGFTLKGYATATDATVAAGGIAGNVGAGEVRNSFTSGITFTGTITNAGGLVGNIASGGAVKNCYSKAAIPAVDNCNNGALVGNNEGTLSNAYTSATTGAVVGDGTAGTNIYAAGPNVFKVGSTGDKVPNYTAPIGADQLGYMYADNLVGTTPLFELLNTNAETLNGNTTATATATENTPGYRTYDRWARPALAYYVNTSPVTIEKPINGDLPVLLMNNYGDGTNGSVGCGGFTALSTVCTPPEIGVESNDFVNKPASIIGEGYVLQYSGPRRDYSAYNNDPYFNDSEIDGMLQRSYNNKLSVPLQETESPDCHFIYGDVSKAPSLGISANRISIYEHAAITEAGTLGSFDKTHVSITFDNSAGELSNASTLNINDLPAQFLPRNWHLLSTPLNNAPIGFNYYLNNKTTNTNVATGWTSGDNGTYANNPWQGGGTATPGETHGGKEFGWLNNNSNGNIRYWMKGWTGSQSNTDGGYANIDLNDVNIGWKDGYFPSTFDATLHDFNQGCIQTADENGRYPYGMDFYSWTEPNYHYINFKRNGPNHWHSDPNADGEHEHLGYKPETASNYASPTENVNEEILLAGKGYFASIAEKTLLQSSGQLGTGTNNNKTIGVTCLTYPNTVPLETGWNLVGNPFHAYLDFHAFSSANSAVGNQYVVYNAALFATPEAERIPLKFEAKDEAGDTYTIHWNTQNGDFHKLYLVDNITGVQYDMLRNSSYSFSGKKDDYWTRFYITFEVTGLDEEQDEDDDASTGSASTTFAFFDGSQWVVTNDGHGTATLDLIDLQGRVLHSTTLAEGQARIGLPDVAKGMYLMRMTNQNGMFVQKIVVR